MVKVAKNNLHHLKAVLPSELTVVVKVVKDISRV
jgi:hypothetical protein